MTLRARYSLLFAGIFAFAVGAPLLLFYVQGKHMALGQKRGLVTGLISIETKPDGASVYINNKLKTETPGAVRFLPTGTYAIQISKDGYYPWQRQVSVMAGRVTHANPNPAKLNLLKIAKPKTIAHDAEVSARAGEYIIYSTPEAKLVKVSSDNLSDTQTIPLPVKARSLLPSTNNGNQVLVLAENFMAVLDTKSFVLTKYAQTPEGFTHLTLADRTVWGLNKDNQLVTLTADGKTTIATPDKSSVASFLVQESETYYLAISSPGMAVLRHARIEGSALSQDQQLAGPFKIGDQNSLYVDTARAVYLLKDTTLERINENTKEIAANVTTTSVLGGSLAYTSSGALVWYDSNNNKQNLVSRSTKVLTSFYLDPKLQYAFFAEDGELIALELDDRGTQNRYVLDSAPEPITGISLSTAGELLYQAGDELKLLEIF